MDKTNDEMITVAGVTYNANSKYIKPTEEWFKDYQRQLNKKREAFLDQTKNLKTNELF